MDDPLIGAGQRLSLRWRLSDLAARGQRNATTRFK